MWPGNGDNDLQGLRFCRGLALDGAKDQDFGPLEIGGDRNGVLTEAQHDFFGAGGQGKDKEQQQKDTHHRLPAVVMT